MSTLPAQPTRAMPSSRDLTLHASNPPDEARIALRVGGLRIKMGAYAQALAAYVHAGTVLARERFVDEAIDAYALALDAAMQEPRLDDRVVHVARALAQLGELAQVRLHDEGDERDERDEDEALREELVALLAPLERRFAREKNGRAAEAVLRILVQIAPAATGYRVLLGDALAQLGDVDGAVRELRASAEQLIAEEANDEALDILERLLALRADAKSARLAAERYMTRALEGDGLRALSVLRLCFTEHPRDVEVLSLLASAFRLAGYPSKAADVERVIARLSLVDTMEAGWSDAPIISDGSELDAALERVDALVAEARLDDARAIVCEQMRRRPTNALLKERLAELEEELEPKQEASASPFDGALDGKDDRTLKDQPQPRPRYS